MSCQFKCDKCGSIHCIHGTMGYTDLSGEESKETEHTKTIRCCGEILFKGEIYM